MLQPRASSGAAAAIGRRRIRGVNPSRTVSRRPWYPELVFDTHAIARSLTDADLTPAQADAITDAIRQAAEHGDHVTAEQFKAGLAEVRTDIADVRAQVANQINVLTWRIVGIVGVAIAVLRWLE